MKGSGSCGKYEAKNDDKMNTADPDVQDEAGGDDHIDVVGCDGDKGGEEES